MALINDENTQAQLAAALAASGAIADGGESNSESYSDADSKAKSYSDSHARNSNDIDNDSDADAEAYAWTGDQTVTIDFGDMFKHKPYGDDYDHDAIDIEDAIDIDYISGIEDSVVMPDVNSQVVRDGNAFNVDQVNNLADNDYLGGASVGFGANGGGDGLDVDIELLDLLGTESDGGVFFVQNATAYGGSANTSGNDSVDESGSAAVEATADAAATAEAFTQSIAMGANVQFNSASFNVAGSDVDFDDVMM